MRKIVFVGMLFGLTAMADEITFDFHDTMSLNPAVNEPGEKSGIEVDGMIFTSGSVSVAFTASDYGNTHVRLYHSYDAGVDLRLYDGDAMTVSVEGDSYISKIKFTMSLSGAASGSSDINFIPSTGNFIWEAEEWTPDKGSMPRSVELVSAQQSRIYTMTVTTDRHTPIRELTEESAHREYYSLLGLKYSGTPTRPGIYIVNGKKVILR